MLTGEPEHEYQKQSATYAVRYLSGVKGISNDIRVVPGVSVVGVQADIKASLKRRAIADARTIHVCVEGTKVILSGSLATWPERELAQSSALHTLGVQEVQNDLLIIPIAA